MGQSISCDCFESTLSDSSSATKERLLRLQNGHTFLKAAYLGLGSKELKVKLSDDSSKLEWKVIKSPTIWSNSEEFGEIDLTSQVKTVKMTGKQGFQFISSADDKTSLLELQAEDPAVRDQWVLALNELMQSWIDHPDTKPKEALSAKGTSDKTEYFKKRQDEIELREKMNAEKKAKYAVGGMKYTAEIMASRPS